VHVDQATSLTAIASAAGTTVETLRELNPALRRFCTPPTGWDVRLPLGSKAQFTEAFDKLGPSERLSFAQHKFERGDSLSKIAKAYGVNEQAILRTNGLKSAKQLRNGSTVMIPLQATHGLLAGEMLEERGRGKSQGRTAHDPSIGRAYTAKPSMTYAKVEEARAKAKAEGKPDPADLAADRQAKLLEALAKQRATRTASAKPHAPVKAGTYVVQQGDSLWSIASKMGTTVDALKRANGLNGKHAHSLQVGQTLAIKEDS